MWGEKMRALWIIAVFVVFVDGVALARMPRAKPTPAPSAVRIPPLAQVLLEKRIERLEKEVRLLRETIEDLGAQLATIRSFVEAQEKELHPKYPLYRVDVDKEEIRRALAEGMTQEAIRKLIGEPNRIDRYAITGTVWYYGMRHVDFGYNGLVVGWFGF